MGRPATGSAQWNPKSGRWEARVTIPGQGRKPVPMPTVPACTVSPSAPPPKCDCASCAQARRVALLVSNKMRASGGVPADVGEVANEWFERYTKLHGELGNGTAQHAGDWARYVAPFIGTKEMSSVTPDDIKAIRDSLTRARLEGKIGAKRVLNVWSTVVKAPFSRAFTDDDPKYGAVRVGPRAANPAHDGIKPPVSVSDRAEDERERQALEPAEGLALLSCEAVPVDARRFYAWAMFSGLRPAELYGLAWADVRDHVIKVQRGRDMKSGEEGDTKTRAGVRDVPIHPHLQPLIEAMRGQGRVFDVERVRDVEGRVDELRAHLRAAGITRPELFDGTATLMPFDVRSFRTTFATWCARSGFDSAWIDAWLGHAPKTTSAKHYVKDTGALTAGVFPVIPAEVVAPPGFGLVSAFRPGGPNDPRYLRCEGRDLNPYRSYPTGT